VTTETIQSAGPVALPRVNLIPPEIAEAERLHTMQRVMALAVIVAVLLVGFLYWHAKKGMTTAQNSLQAAKAQNAALETKYTALNYVQTDFNAAQAKQDMLDQAMSQEIRWSFVLQDLTTRIPNDVWLTGLSAAETTAPGSTATPATPTPGSPTGIGTVTFSGTAFSHDDVANWLEALAKIKGFAAPSFSSSTKASIGTRVFVNFGTQATVTEAALSNRYTAKAGS
jgi:Tfp pilus assembly protein PilN